jgi:hypothetical protein
LFNPRHDTKRRQETGEGCIPGRNCGGGGLVVVERLGEPPACSAEANGEALH